MGVGKDVQADGRMRSSDLVGSKALIEAALASSHVRQYQTCVCERNAVQRTMHTVFTASSTYWNYHQYIPDRSITSLLVTTGLLIY